jgi:N-acetyl-1-D-myo-inositol-2-amino-2-deoxy-alpha-D-glucopyranoside deacetylase
VREWYDRKWAAIQAHVSEAERGAAPGLLATLPEAMRRAFLGTEWYLRR